MAGQLQQLRGYTTSYALVPLIKPRPLHSSRAATCLPFIVIRPGEASTSTWD